MAEDKGIEQKATIRHREHVDNPAGNSWWNAASDMQHVLIRTEAKCGGPYGMCKSAFLVGACEIGGAMNSSNCTGIRWGHAVRAHCRW
jgi:hypothetical protein